MHKSPSCSCLDPGMETRQCCEIVGISPRVSQSMICKDWDLEFARLRAAQDFIRVKATATVSGAVHKWHFRQHPLAMKMPHEGRAPLLEFEPTAIFCKRTPTPIIYFCWACQRPTSCCFGLRLEPCAKKEGHRVGDLDEALGPRLPSR